MTLAVPEVVSFIVSLAVAVAMCPTAGLFAARTGVVSRPRPDRWSGRPTPMLGGIAIASGCVVPLVALVGGDERVALVAVGVAGAFLLGLIDDVRGLRPTSKIVGQLALATWLALGGVRVEIIEFQPLSFALTVVWIVGMMNALNLVDNMDGLAAGLAAIAATVLVLMAPADPAWIGVLSAAVAGSCFGFLLFNFPPARIYMGDAGSHTLGFALGAIALIQTNTAASGVGLAILGPLLVLGVPIFDTALVTIVRGIEGRPVSQGGRDHTSHRLAALGLTERETVLTLYAIAGVLATGGLLASAFGLVLLPLIGLILVGLLLFGVFIVERPEPGRPGVSEVRSKVLMAGRVLIRYGGEIGLDATLASIALFASIVLRFEGAAETVWVQLFLEAAPIVVPIQLAAFVVLGVYRTLWRHVDVTDLITIARAAVIGSSLAFVVVFIALSGMSGQSRAAFVLDAILLPTLVFSARMFLRWLRYWSRLRPRAGDRRVLIAGANDGGEVALRLLLRSREAAYHPAGFLDDDPGKQRRRIGGIPVLGRLADLDAVAQGTDADLVILALEDAGERERMRRLCATLGLETREFHSL